MKFRVSGIMDTDTWCYKNCKTQRKRGAKICETCPIRDSIVEFERKQKEKQKQ